MTYPVTVTGASTGDSVHLGLPSSPTAGIIFMGVVSAVGALLLALGYTWARSFVKSNA